MGDRINEIVKLAREEAEGGEAAEATELESTEPAELDTVEVPDSEPDEDVDGEESTATTESAADAMQEAMSALERWIEKYQING